MFKYPFIDLSESEFWKQSSTRSTLQRPSSTSTVHGFRIQFIVWDWGRSSQLKMPHSYVIWLVHYYIVCKRKAFFHTSWSYEALCRLQKLVVLVAEIRSGAIKSYRHSLWHFFGVLQLVQDRFPTTERARCPPVRPSSCGRHRQNRHVRIHIKSCARLPAGWTCIVTIPWQACVPSQPPIHLIGRTARALNAHKAC